MPLWPIEVSTRLPWRVSCIPPIPYRPFNGPKLNRIPRKLNNFTKQEIKVTKRATEVTNETVSSSEFVRITTEDGVRGIPSIGARRILSKWRVVSDSVVEGIQIVYDVGGNLGDPLSMGLGGGGGPGSSGPQVVSKVRLHLERIQ